MSIDRVAELARRLFMLGGFALLALAAGEKIANLQGQTMIRTGYLPSDLAQYATMLMVFAIALLLSGFRDELRRR
jgi:hypothetical protein